MVTLSPQSKPAELERAATGPSESDYPEQFWQSLLYFNIYRVIVACGIVIITWTFHFTNLGAYHFKLFFYVALGYVFFSIFSILLIKHRQPGFDWQLTFQVGSDIVFISILIYANGGVQSGLGLLLLISLAGAGLISRGRLALLFASIASLGILLQETYSFFHIGNYQVQYSQAGLLSMGYFAVAWLAHRLARHAIANEQLALERGTDLANMAQVNQLVIQDLQEGILVVDKEGYIRQHNTYAEKLIGHKLESSLRTTPKLADYVPILATRLIAWRGDNKTNFDLLRLPVSNILVRTRFVPVENNKRAGVVIFLEDMSRIQAQVQQLKLAALGRLTANIAHEIRNPLSAINHATELLEEEQHTNPTYTRLLRIIGDNTQRLNKIVQDVLQLNRRDIAEPEIIDIVDFIHIFITDFCLSEKIKSDAFILNATENDTISFDRGHLNQILWNLCRNAWRHCQQKSGSIQIKLSKQIIQNYIYLDVIDDGPGIFPIQLKQLFEPFYTTVAQGTGLGLYIAREMCEANQASLEYIDNKTGGHFRIICKKGSNHAQE